MKYKVVATSLVVVGLLASSMVGAQAQTFGADDWTGVYVGVNGGLQSEEFRDILDDPNVSGGAQLGYRSELGPVVVGAELEGTYTHGQSFTTGGAGVVDQKWSGAAKVMAGVGLGSTLVYGIGGYGVAKLESGTAATDEAGWAGGFLFGGGVEQQLGGGLSAKLEYTQMRLNNVETFTGGTAYSDDLVNHSIKAGLNFQF